MAPSSSADKVAKLASRGKGKKVRFTGGTLFPVIVAGLVVALLGLVVYARQSLPPDGAGSPKPFDGISVGEHWHAAFAVRVCDTWQPKLIGNKEETKIDPVTGDEVAANEQFRVTGIHSHNDGVIHWHANSSRASGNRAKLGVFLDVYGLELTEDSLTIPADQGGGTFSTAETKCGDQPTELKVVVWDSFSRPNESRDVITDFRNIRVKNDGMVMVIAFVPKGTDVPFPGFACGLREIGASDGGDLTTTTASASTTSSGAATTTTTPQVVDNNFECVDPTTLATTTTAG